MNDFASTADHWGVAQGYHDVFGHWHALDPQTLAQLVAALSTSKGGPQPPEPFSYPSSVERAYQGDERRVWGIAVQLYAVRSRVNWGHGDFGDLSRLLAVAAGCGAAAVGLNPLHALFPDRAEQASPTAGYFLIHFTSTSKRSRNFPALKRRDLRRTSPGCGRRT
jgi:4-alpha-glucanotransferase